MKGSSVSHFGDTHSTRRLAQLPSGHLIGFLTGHELTGIAQSFLQRPSTHLLSLFNLLQVIAVLVLDVAFAEIGGAFTV